ncbi:MULTISPECIES: energy transducer TonB [unclassified Vibrio]|uniref:energy transducer TonB n=1 Tax=unclassified Vibrio TaxID=2614977 RepID=UPI001267CBE3|nr:MULTISPECIES: energy transducer TonB [unclassified Vibrio]MCM5507065.1 energy transducer TonB [Vibrio sp. SCSIO 43169]QFT36585.1 transport protein TonB [Vibrio sp. THAF64]QGM34486.1 transport protein TonB [Vibrio sp. THAF191d]QGN69988.1 transport protein TonB [Vibrio sp. THAF191c]
MGRLLIATPLAAVCALAIFSFMAWMVDSGHRRAPDPSESLSFNMVMVENEQDVQRRQRTVPEQPKAPEVPEQMPTSQANTELSQISPISQPSLGLNTSIEGLAISAPTFGDFGVNQEAIPLYRVEPRYPTKAMKRQAEGYVVLKFTIDPTGRPTDIEVVEASPKRMFERNAIQALRKWKYQPKVVDGVAVSQPNKTARVEFNLAK